MTQQRIGASASFIVLILSAVLAVKYALEESYGIAAPWACLLAYVLLYRDAQRRPPADEEEAGL